MNFEGDFSFFTDADCYNHGDFHIKEKEVKKDLRLAYMKMKSGMDKKNTEIEGGSDFTGISISFNMDGRFIYENEDMRANLIENSTSILYTPRAHGNISFFTPTHENITIQIAKSFLGKDFFDQLCIDLSKDNLLKNESTKIYSLNSLKDIISSPYEGVLESIFTEGKILEIIANEFSTLLKKDKKVSSDKGIVLSDQDIKALYKAKEILIRDIENPPSIKELSRMVAVNEFKLKVGFKTLFKTTPYSVVRDHRMKTAKRLLESSQYNVSEVAKLVGIKNPAHFSRCFFSYHKKRPKDVLKTKKYYYE